MDNRGECCKFITTYMFFAVFFFEKHIFVLCEIMRELLNLHKNVKSFF